MGLASDGPLADVVRACVEEAGRRLAAACWSEDDKRARATEWSDLSTALFGGNGDRERGALRGLLLVRGLGDALGDGSGRPCQELARLPSACTHSSAASKGFIAVGPGEGVAPAFRSENRLVGCLSMERTVTEEQAGGEDEALPLRLFEMLYCECCGEMFVGGMRRRPPRQQ